MTIERDVTDVRGKLLVGKGYTVTPSLIERIANWRMTTRIDEPIAISEDPSQAV